jgi:hypothetical protein
MALTVIAQQKDPIFQDPPLVMLELTLAIHVLEAAPQLVKRAWWPNETVRLAVYM